jgi:hypothetical protein
MPVFSSTQREGAVPMTLGAITLAGVGLLFAWDLFPVSFPAGAHDFLAAFPLPMIAVSYLVYSAAHGPVPLEFVEAIMLAIAFLCWVANQRWPGLRRATLLNHIAIALFVLDVFLVMIGLLRPMSNRAKSLLLMCS